MLTRFAWLRPTVVLIALVPVATLCWIAAIRAQRVVWIPLAALWCLLGTWCAEVEPRPAPAPEIAALSDGLLRSVEGTVADAASVRSETLDGIDEPSSAVDSQRVDLLVSNIEIVTDEEDTQSPTNGKVRLTVRWPERITTNPFRCGERVRAVVRLLPAEVYRDPGVWNRQDYLLDQGITSTASVDVDHVELLNGTLEESLACKIAALRSAASDRLLGLPAQMQHTPGFFRMGAEDVAMLTAMTTGDRTYLTHTLRVGFEQTGSFHMLVVSGFHLAIVAGCLFWVARRLRIPRVPATLWTIAASFAYAVFTGFATPVQRSLAMVTLYLLGQLVYRDRNPLNIIGFATLCLLVVSPRSLFDSGLQMTLLAVIAIAGVAAPLLQVTVHPYVNAARDLKVTAIDAQLEPRLAQFRVVLRMLAARMQRAVSRFAAWRALPWTVRFALRCIELVAVSVTVELAMTLPMAMYFHRITVFALPVNLLLLPLLAVLMPVALATLLAVVVWPVVSLASAMATAALLHSGVLLVHFFGSLSFSDLRIPAPLLWQSCGFCVLLTAAIVLARGGRWQRRAAWMTIVLAATCVVAPCPIDHPRNALMVEAIDVGQGDSLLLITPDGKTLLVAGGGLGGGPRQARQGFDIGEEIVSPALWARGIRKLDFVALSHAHSDHMGGLPAVLRNFHPTELWVGNNPPVPAYAALLDEARNLQVKLRSLRAGDEVAFGAAQVNVVAPFRDYQPETEPGNNDSLVLHVAYKKTSVLLEGDAEAPIERAMLSESGLASTLLKVGHHGSVTSTQPEFLARVAPQWAVISCGLGNRYGHPRAEVLAELQAAHVRTFSTDVDGATCFELNGATVVPEEKCHDKRLP
ncbi:MAG TPA: ComEC/Rec2 family competence protein [Terracidiphilus sp.]|nr:ComEC/Rec2 family competence protein [Terracidiphilus sp.]